MVFQYSRLKENKEYSIEEKLFFQKNICLRNGAVIHLTEREMYTRELLYVLILYQNITKDKIPNSFTSSILRSILSKLSKYIYEIDKGGIIIPQDDRTLFNKLFVALIGVGILDSEYRKGVGKPAWILKFNKNRLALVKKHNFKYADLIIKHDDYLLELIQNAIIKSQEDWKKSKKKIFKKYPKLTTNNNLIFGT